MEALAGGRKLSTEEKIAKMQKEIQSQVKFLPSGGWLVRDSK